MPSSTKQGTDLMKRKVIESVMDNILMSKIYKPELVERMKIDKEGINELAENIKQVGLINALTVKPVGSKFEIVAGHRRYLALKMLGVKKVMVKIITETKAASEIVKLSENLLREDLNDWEEAVMLSKLKKLQRVDNRKLAKSIGKSEPYIRQKLAILAYPDLLKEALQKGLIKFSVARELSRIKNENLLYEYLKHAINGGATPALVKDWVDEIIREEKRTKQKDEAGGIEAPAAQIVAPIFECAVTGEKTDLANSSLIRVCYDCQKELKIGG